MPAVINDLKRTVFPIDSAAPLYGGPSLSNMIADVDVETAKFRPKHTSHSIWQIILHAAYWRREVAHVLSSGAINRFPRGPENWPSLPATLDAATWDADRQLLCDAEQAFLDALSAFNIDQWSDTPPTGGEWSLGQLALGLVAHDAYHIGQVALLKKLARGAAKDPSVSES